MIKYSDLVQYTKDNHINWNTDLFDVLKGFFEQYSQLSSLPNFSTQQESFILTEEFHEPEDGEYTSQDLINLFSQ